MFLCAISITFYFVCRTHEDNVQEHVGDAESESELDLLAEADTESDSDDQDNPESVQRSTQQGAAQGSDTGIGPTLYIHTYVPTCAE